MRLRALQHKATAPAPRKGAGRAACAVCTEPLPAGVPSGECAECADVMAMFDGVAAVKAAFGACRYESLFPAEVE